MSSKEVWRVEGLDTFAGERYPIAGTFPTEEDARQVALEAFLKIEETQPRESSGGQDDDGIQDHIFVIRPDGTEFRFLPTDWEHTPKA